MPVTRQRLPVKRYFTKGEFNVRSRDQLLAYMEGRGLEGGELSEKSGKPKVDKKVLEGLAKKDPLFRKILDYKALQKVESTYADAAQKQLLKGPRLHYSFFHKPSTMRLSSGKPFNIQNVVADKDDENPANGFRQSVVAAEGCTLLEADKAAVEAVVTGWVARAPNYIRLASLGVHDYLTSHLVGKPANLKWPDAELGKYFKGIKATHKTERELAKKVVHGSNYGLSPYGMAKRYPEMFTVASATQIQDLYFRICPEIKKFQDEARLLAHKQGYLGLNKLTNELPHPFSYRHWFWDVFGFNTKSQRVQRGGDHDRVVAYPGQSISAGLIYEDALEAAPLLADLGPDLAGSCQPIRALIHDSILCEVRDSEVERACALLQRVMTRPIPQLPCPPEWGLGEFLSIGVSIKVGKNWASESAANPQGMREIDLGTLGTAADSALYEEEDEEEEVAISYGFIGTRSKSPLQLRVRGVK